MSDHQGLAQRLRAGAWIGSFESVDMHAAATAIETLEAELAQARETNAKLNRRCQGEYARGVKDASSKRNSGRELERSLRDKAETGLAAARDEAAALREALVRIHNDPEYAHPIACETLGRVPVAAGAAWRARVEKEAADAERERIRARIAECFDLWPPSRPDGTPYDPREWRGLIDLRRENEIDEPAVRRAGGEPPT